MIQDLINKLLLGNTSISGFRTIIVNTILMIIAAWDFFTKDGGIFDMLCDTFKILCTINEAEFYLTAFAIVTALNNILRWLTVAPVGVHASPQQLSMARNNPNGFATLAVILSFVVIGGIIIFMITS